MKKVVRIQVTHSHPAPGQCGIPDLIGKEFIATRNFTKSDASDGIDHRRFATTVSINVPEYGGSIILQPSEFRYIFSDAPEGAYVATQHSVPHGGKGKPRIKQNIWGNWNGYLGTERHRQWAFKLRAMSDCSRG